MAAGEPRRAGQWELTTRLGAGGMGTVYLGSDGHRSAAVKVIAAGLADDPGFRDRFRREVDVCRRVSGAQIAELLDADPDDEVPWLAVRYVPGPTLREAVDAHGPLAGETLTGFAIATAEALRQIHRSGVVHRDLKPSNVILTPETPVIIDFGIASIAEATSLTATGTVLGSAGWMAPEQILGQPSGPTADVFSWGALVVFAATGKPPFGEGRPEALAYRIVHGDADLEGVPIDLRTVVDLAMSRDAQERPSVESLLEALTGTSDSTQIADGIAHTWVSEAATVVATAPVAEAPSRAVKVRRRRPSLLTVVTVVVALAMVAGIALFVTQDRTNPPDQAAADPGRMARATTSAPPVATSNISTTAAPTTTAVPSTTAAPTTTTPPSPTLEPATVPSAAGVCESQLDFGANGTASPVLCDDGRVNRLAWEYYVDGAASLIAAGPYAGPEDVRAAICLDLYNSTFMQMLGIYDMVEAYYGWSFGVPPTDVITGQQTGENPNACDAYPMDGE